METDLRLQNIVKAQPYPLLFATISGAHLYGFPSPDSDVDLRGVHLLPHHKLLGLASCDETVQDERVVEGLEMDIVTHDAKKFFNMLLKKNGYVLEQLYSPLIVQTTEAHERLKAITAACITRNHSYHYLGFAETQWRLFMKESPRRVKPLLYVYRVLLTGIWLMRTGEVEANLLNLNSEFNLPQIEPLVAQKLAGPEQSELGDAEVSHHQLEYERLRQVLVEAHTDSHLREVPSDQTKRELNTLLLQLRGCELPSPRSSGRGGAK